MQRDGRNRFGQGGSDGRGHDGDGDPTEPSLTVVLGRRMYFSFSFADPDASTLCVT
jgi:hypothetical protein